MQLFLPNNTWNLFENISWYEATRVPPSSLFLEPNNISRVLFSYLLEYFKVLWVQNIPYVVYIISFMLTHLHNV